MVRSMARSGKLSVEAITMGLRISDNPFAIDVESFRSFGATPMPLVDESHRSAAVCFCSRATLLRPLCFTKKAVPVKRRATTVRRPLTRPMYVCELPTGKASGVELSSPTW